MLPANTTSTSLGYQPALDGLRGVFVAAVLFFHGGFSWAAGGYLGVSAFFTLSGFLIGSLLIDEHARTGRINLGRFWIRRARRLLPAAWITLAIAVVYGLTLASSATQRALPGDVVSSLLYVVNWHFILAESSYETLFTEPSPVAHMWSLAIEEQFYVVFPLLVGAVLAISRGRRTVLAAVLMALVAASTVWMAFLHDPGVDTARVYYGTDTRVAEMLVGALAALGWRRLTSAHGERLHRYDRSLQVVALVALAALVLSWTQVSVSSSGLYRGGLLLHSIAVVGVLVAALRPGLLGRVASFEPLRRLGLISYGVYLYHWPIFLWLNPARTGLDGWSLFILRSAVTLVAATASYLLVEQPIRAGTRLRGWSGLVAVPTVAIVILAGTAMVPSPAPTAFQSASLGSEVDPFADLEDHEVPDVDTTRELGVPRVAVFGDSTAMSVFHGLLDVDSTSGDLVVVPGRIVLGCGLVRAPVLRSGGEEFVYAETCNDWVDDWPPVFDLSEPDIAVVLFGPWDVSDHQLESGGPWVSIGDPAYDELVRAEIHEALDVLNEQVELVVWLTSPPIDQGRGKLDGGDDPASQPERMERWNQLLREEVAAHPGSSAVVVDLDAWFQDLPDGPFDETLRPDGVHVDPDQAPRVGRWLAQQILVEWSERNG